MKLTVLTPTCREYSYLITLGESLQENVASTDYIWIVIYNSVSNEFFHDQHKRLQSHFKNKSPQILFCEHPGKAASVYYGTRAVNTDYFTIINDKDILLSDPLIHTREHQLSESDIGYCFPIKTDTSKVLYTKIFSASLIDAYLSKKIFGDQLVLYKSCKALKYFFPPIFNETYLPEDVKHLLAHQDSSTYLFVPEYILSRKYLRDGLTCNYERVLRTSPLSTIIYLYLMIKNINSLSNIRLLRSSAKILYLQMDAMKRPFLSSLILILMLSFGVSLRLLSKLSLVLGPLNK